MSKQHSRRRIKVDATIPSQWEENFRAYLDAQMTGQTVAKSTLMSAFVASHGLVQRPDQPLFSTLSFAEAKEQNCACPILLANALHNSKDAFLEVDFKETPFDEQETLLLGGPNAMFGQVPVLSGSNLLDSRGDSELPVSIVVFHNVEYASPVMAQVLMEICSKGEIKLWTGEVVDFRDCVLFATTTLRGRHIARMKYLYETTEVEGEQLSGLLKAEAVRAIRADFVATFSTVMVMDSLEVAAVHEALNSTVTNLNARVRQASGIGMEIVLEKSARAFVVKQAILAALRVDEVEAGSGDVHVEAKRLLDNYVIYAVNQLLMRGKVRHGERVVFVCDDDRTLTPFVEEARAKKPNPLLSRMDWRRAKKMDIFNFDANASISKKGLTHLGLERLN